VPVYCDSPKWTRDDELSGHLVGEPLEALHEIAAKIGLSPFRYFQPQATVAHYQLPASLRADAIAAGAVPLEGAAFYRALERIYDAQERARRREAPAKRAETPITTAPPTPTREPALQCDLFNR
jgi:hypothetical protein